MENLNSWNGNGTSRGLKENQDICLVVGEIPEAHLFTYVTETDRKKRHIQIGVYNRAAFLTKRMETKYSTDIKDKCRMIVSKLTGDVVRWLGKIMEFESKCEEDEQSCEIRIPANGN